MGLQNLNGWEMIVIILLGLFIFGPEKLPKIINDGLRMLRQLRKMARNATDDLSRELGTTIDLEDLHPKTFLRKHLLSEEDEQLLRKPFKDVFTDLRDATDSINSAAKSLTKEATDVLSEVSLKSKPVQLEKEAPRLTKGDEAAATASPVGSPAPRPVYDDDAT